MGKKQSCLLQPKDVQDIITCTDFSKDDIMEWYVSFHNEAATDDRLSLEEFKNIYKQIFPDGDSATFAEHVFRYSFAFFS